MTYYTIREVSEMMGLTASTLRYYEDVGLLTDVARTASGQRLYTQENVNRLGTIGCFKETGMTIAQIQTFFHYEENEAECIDDMLALLEERRQAVLEQLRVLEKDYTQISRKLNYYGDLRAALKSGGPHPDWSDYKDRIYAATPAAEPPQAAESE